MNATRLAAKVVVTFPILVVSVAFLATALGHQTSGAGVADGNRPIVFLMMAPFALLAWIIGTSALFILVKPATRLPRSARELGSCIVFGFRPPVARVGYDPVGPVVSGGHSVLSPVRLFALGFVNLPFFLWLAPMLLGWLLQPVVYRPVEAAAVGAMGVLVTAWTVFLLNRTRQRD